MTVEGLGEAELRDLADRMGAYRADHSVVSLLGIESDGIDFPVSTDAGANERMIDVVGRMQADARIVDADLTTLSFTVATGGDAFALAAELPGLAAELATAGADAETDAPSAGPTADRGVDFEIASQTEEVRLRGEYGAWVRVAEAVSAAVGSDAELIEVSATPDTLELLVRDERAVAGVTEIAERLAASAGMEVTVSSDALRVDPGTDGERARRLLERLDAGTAARIERTEAVASTLRVAVRSLDDALPVAEKLDVMPEAQNFSTIAVQVLGPDGQAGRTAGSLEVFAAPGSWGDRVGPAVELKRVNGVDAVSIAAGRVEMTAADDVAGGDFGRFAPALEAAADDEDWVCIFSYTASTLCVTAAPQLRPTADDAYADHPAYRAFVEAWNSAS